MARLAIIDPLIYALIEQEKNRQKSDINLIASENYTDDAILEVMSSVLTNKYAEGYPGKRYYAGCAFVDLIEQEAIVRCKELFEVEHANVQPHSGSSANMAVYNAILKPGDTILSMNLAAGGHLTHGHAANFSGKLYHIIHYGVDKVTELLDYEEIEKLAYTHKPRLIIAGASAYSRFIDFEQFSAIAQSVNAYLMVDIAHIAGLVAAHLHSNPAPYADFITGTTHKTLRGPRGGFILCKQKFAEVIDRSVMPGIQGGPHMHSIAAKAVTFSLALQPEFKEYQKQVVLNAAHMADAFSQLGYRIVSGGTDNHLFIIDLSSKNITGKLAEELLGQAGISVSRSCIPYDLTSPWITSGIRIGTPAITSRGYKQQDCTAIVDKIDSILLQKQDF